jgi:uncharacterized protein
MSGTKSGGKRAALTNKQVHGEDFFRRIGAMGGLVSRGGGFTKETGALYGAIGGAMSRRGPAKLSDAERLEIKLHSIKRQASKVSGPLRRQLLAQKRELSNMQVSSLSSKYGQKRAW